MSAQNFGLSFSAHSMFFVFVLSDFATKTTKVGSIHVSISCNGEKTADNHEMLSPLS